MNLCPSKDSFDALISFLLAVSNAVHYFVNVLWRLLLSSLLLRSSMKDSAVLGIKC